MPADVRQMILGQELFIMHPVKIFTARVTITGATDIVHVLKLTFPATPIPFVNLPLLQNRLKDVIRYGNVPVAGRCLQPYLLFRIGLWGNVLFLCTDLPPPAAAVPAASG